MKKLKAAEIVLDFDLYPRNNIDSANVTNITAAMEAGVEMPPVIIDRTSKRCIDGFHRVRAALRLHGDNAEIQVIEKDYPNEKEMFLDAMRYNAGHGAKLDPNDRTRCAIIAERLHITMDRVAGALNMTKAKLEVLRETRVAKHDGLQIALKQTVRHFCGKRLTRAQVAANAKLSGMNQSFYANQLITLIESEMLDTDDERLMIVLRKLHGLLEGLLIAT